MGKIKISYFQLFCLMFLFEMGSSVLFSIAGAAKQDAWLVVLISMVPGCVLIGLYLKMHQMFPGLSLTGYVQKIFGTSIGRIIGFLYVIYFIYIASRLLRDFSELLVISAYQETTLIVIGTTMLLCLIYTLFKGLEVFSRLTELCLYVIIPTFLFIVLLQAASGLIVWKNLTPILEYGWKPVLKEAFPKTITVPFGELIVFTMVFPLLENVKKTIKTAFISVIFSGLFLSLITALTIAVIGPSVRYRSAFPILTAVSYIDIGGFIQRLDALVIVSIIIVGFIKIFLFFYCAVKGSMEIFQVKEPRTLIFPISFIILMGSIFIAPNYIEHIKEGLTYVPFYLHIPFQIVLPAFILLIAWLKQLFAKKPQKT
ncbi:GerAB/ArcD/ProY family transporter [Peribacillus sp. B-H-3]|uniref:GerAB/ArcD/ProY family transporter n=1 Tax=Peribacillus sp. B-H-3 TaxID=3400420 RepID=UPI003B021E1B